MAEAYIVAAARTAGGRRGGRLSGWHPADLGAQALNALVDRAGIDPALVEDVIMGCVMQVGEQGINIARNAALAAGFPETTVGTTIDRQCGSSQQAAHFAAQGVMAGVHDIVIAAGVEVMTRVPMGATVMSGPGLPFGSKMNDRYATVGGLVPQGISAELIADKWGLSREELDAFSVQSHQRAARAIEEGRFEKEIVAVSGADGGVFDRDEGVRPESSVEKLATLKPAFKPDGKVTAGNSSQISDGAAALLIMSEDRAKQLGLTPRARFHTFALAGVDPVMMLTGPIPATTKVLERAKMTIDQMDLIEINEAFAPVVLSWEKEHHPDMSKVNVNGGAIALGHPVGSTGSRLITTALHELERSDRSTALVAMCCGNSLSSFTIIERI